MTPDGIPRGWSEGAWPEVEDRAEEGGGLLSDSAPTVAEHQHQGPCLYLGPAGQRCNRPALSGGFCAVHRPGGRGNAIKDPARILAAAGAIVALLWPYVEALVREIIRWTHSH